MKLVYIKWFDACSCSGNQYPYEIDDGVYIETAGIFVKETKVSIILAQDYDAKEGTYRHSKSIPKKYITKKKVVKL